jgi:hypothetical protein
MIDLYGLVSLPIQLDYDTKTSRFTLKSGPDRFFIKTVDLEHFELMETVQETTKFFILGDPHTHRGPCGQDHVHINPVFMIDLDHTPPGDVDVMLVAMRQWIVASMALKTRRNGKYLVR